ncbi:MAG: IS4 family transposase [Thermodesulfobacteriota bacterium]
MDTTKQFEEQQEAKRLHDRIAAFMTDLTVGTLLHKSGIRKLRGAPPLRLFTAIFRLPFEGVNFSRGIVLNASLDFRKDAAYELLRNPRHNWRKFLLALTTIMVRFFTLLTDDEREKVLILDDSTYDRSRSKKVELLSWIHDHNSGRSLKGFKLLTLGWSDGNSFLPLDFVLCASAKAQKRLQGITKVLDKRCCGYRRRMEAIAGATANLKSMVKRVLNLGIEADYLLMDSWFSFSSLLKTLAEYLPVICMAKDMPNIFYRYDGELMRLSRLYGKLTKRPGKAKILASVITETTKGQKVKIVFVRHRHKRDWLAILSTKTDLHDAEIVRIYGKRWDIEVFFKMMKHYLNLEREVQLRDYDGIIGHITIVMTRYVFLSLEQRRHDDPRTLGTLFFACCAECADLTLAGALERLLHFATEKMQTAGVAFGAAMKNQIEAIMSAALDILHSNRLLSQNNNEVTMC